MRETPFLLVDNENCYQLIRKPTFLVKKKRTKSSIEKAYSYFRMLLLTAGNRLFGDATF